MADISVEKKSGMSWIWWIVGLIVLALIIWGISEAMEPDETASVAVIPADMPATTGAPITDAAAPVAVPVLVVHEIVVGPEAWIGKRVSGTAQVSEVPTDRGFWLGSGSDRIFAVLNDHPAEQPLNINPGQTVQVTDALVLSDISKVPGNIDADTREIAQQQPVFLNVDESNVQMASDSVAGAPAMQP